MSHFNLENEINEATRLDAPIERGPLARWQRKALEAGVKSLSLDGLNLSGLSGPRSGVLSAKAPRTPLSSKTLTDRLLVPGNPKTPRLKTPCVKTPGGRTPEKQPKTPSKTPGKSKKSNSKTPTKSPHGQDRFIPNRSAMDLESCHHMLTMSYSDNTSGEQNSTQDSNSSKMSRALSEGNLQDHKILAFNQKAPRAKEGYINNLKVLYSSGAGASAQKGVQVSRQIPQQAEKIMDAPDLLDDYYLNLLSWSSNNHLAVALGSNVYIWDAGNGKIEQLTMHNSPDEYISSLAWVQQGNFLATADCSGNISVWDVAHQKMMRVMQGHTARVGALSWNSYVLSSGSRSGAIWHHDVRVPNHHVGTLNYHSQEVCGLAWSPDGRHLASGGNDNQVCIWNSELSHDSTPVHTFSDHQAAVKAIAWCPWQPNLLATGGGTNDRHIRFWNVTTGSCVNSVDTNSQVCALVWNAEHKEIISGHGFSQNQLTLWKYPSMARITNLIGHQSRILCLAASPDGTTIASAAADETIRLWKCFASEKRKKSVKTKPVKSSTASMMMKGIR